VFKNYQGCPLDATEEERETDRLINVVRKKKLFIGYTDLGVS